MQVQAEYIAMIEKFSAEKLALEDLLAERDEAYVGLLQVRLLLLRACLRAMTIKKREVFCVYQSWGTCGSICLIPMHYMGLRCSLSLEGLELPVIP